MILKQYYLECLAQASYLIADETSGVAAIVDPRRDIDEYVADAESLGLEIRHVVLSHLHADFVAGHLELRARCGARIHLGRGAVTDFEFSPLADGDSIELGSVRLDTLETPGHTPEGISLLVFDLSKDAERPHAVLTGDTLFIGDVGRPDLLASVGSTAEELAGMLYDSLHTKLLALPDETLVYPAHGAGSMCGKNLSKETVSTIGDQRRFNYALQPISKQEFIERVTADQPEAPAYFAYDVAVNRSEREILSERLERSLKPLSLDALLEAQVAGAQILDTRDPAQFENGHLAGSTNVGLGGSYATWAGSVLDPQLPIAIIAEPGRERESMLRLGRIGFDNLVGYLQDGWKGAQARPELLRRVERLEPAQLRERLAAEPSLYVLDVRTAREYADGRIGDSVNIPLNRLTSRLDELPRDREIVLHCRSGYRSSVAAGLLEQGGFERLSDLAGGILAWQASE